MFHFFSKEDPLNVIMDDNPISMYKSKSKTVYDLLKYMEDIYDVDFIKRGKCKENQSPYQLHPINGPTNIFEYYDLAKFIEGNREFCDISNLRKLYNEFKFDKDSSMKVYSVFVEKFLEVQNINESYYYDVETFISYLTKFMEYINEYMKLTIYTKEMEYVFCQYKIDIGDIILSMMKLSEHKTNIEFMIKTLNEETRPHLKIIISEFLTYVPILA